MFLRIFLFLVLLGTNIFSATSALQMDFLMSGVIKTNGTVAAAGKAYFWESSSKTTTKNVWADANKNVVLSQPVILDSRGCATVFGDGVYYSEIYDKTNILIKSFNLLSYLSRINFGDIYTDVLTSYGGNGAAIASALLDVDASLNYTFMFRDQDFLISQNITFPSNVNLKFINGGALNTSVGYTVSINGLIESVPYRILKGLGTYQVSDKNNLQSNVWLYGDIASSTFHSKLGIGTTSPSQALDVIGTSNISAGLVIDTNTLYVNGGNNRIGIGTTTPNQLLDINGITLSDYFYENWQPLKGKTTFSDYQDGVLLLDDLGERVTANWVLSDDSISYPTFGRYGRLYLGNSFILPSGYSETITFDAVMPGGSFDIRLQSSTDFVTWTTLQTFLGSGSKTYAFSPLSSSVAIRFQIENMNGTSGGELSMSDLVIPNLPISKSVGFSGARVFGNGLISKSKVGIGTTSPSQALDVVGTANVSIGFTVDTNTLFVNGGNNRVGIGTTLPAAMLQVAGNLSASGNLAISGTGNIMSGLIVDTNTLYVNGGSNRVGIGTTTPTSSFQVTGTANILNGIIGGNLRLNNQVACSLVQTIGTNIGTGFPSSLNRVLFDTEEYDIGNMHSTVSNTGRITAPSSGYYLIGGQLGGFSVNRCTVIEIWKNGDRIGAKNSSSPSANAGVDGTVSVTSCLKLLAGDYVELFGGSVASNTQGAGLREYTNFWAVKLF